MATAKKTAVKKTATKRPYRRRAKPVEAPEIQPEVNTAAELDTDAMQATPTAEPPESPAWKQQVEFLDLRGCDIVQRLGVLASLTNAGFIWADSQVPLLEDTSMLTIEADTIKLNHKNKLASYHDWHAASQSQAVSRVNVHPHFHLSVEEPRAAVKDMIEVDGRYYALIG